MLNTRVSESTFSSVSGVHLVSSMTVFVREFKEAGVIAKTVVQNAIHPLCLFFEDSSKVVEERLEP